MFDMKKLNVLFVLVCMMLLAVGCQKKVNVSFVSPSIHVTAAGEEVLVSLTSNGDWSVVSYPEWLSVSPTDGSGDSQLKVTVLPNLDVIERMGEIKVSSKDNTTSMTVTQEARETDFITVNPDHYQCGMEGGEFNVTVSSNIAWTVSQLPNWMTCTPMEGAGNVTVALTINAIADETAVSREVDVVFGNEETHATLHVTQLLDPQISISVTPNWLDVVSEGESKPISLTCDGAWTSTIIADWVTMDKTQGEGNAEIMVTAAANPTIEPRETMIVLVSSTNLKAYVTVRQEAAPDPHFLEVSPQSFNFGKEGGQQTLTIGCDTDWLIELSDNWLSLSEMAGTGNATLTLTAAPNTIFEPREIVFAVVSGNLSRRVEVTQEAGDDPVWVSFSMDTLFVPYAGGTTSGFGVTSNTLWYLTASSWITNLPMGATQGDATLYPIIDVNSSETPRYGYIKALHNGQVMAEMIVAQEGKPDLLETDITEYDARPEGAEFTIHITSNQNWVVSCDVEWMHYSPDNGFAHGDVRVQVDPMMSMRPREGHIVIKADSGKMVVVTVTQHY